MRRRSGPGPKRSVSCPPSIDTVSAENMTQATASTSTTAPRSTRAAGSGTTTSAPVSTAIAKPRPMRVSRLDCVCW